MNKYKTEQEYFWAGAFGDEYVERNRSARLLASNIVFFSKIISQTAGVQSLIEFGANIGMNLHAFRALLPDGDLSAVEINERAVKELKKIDKLTVYPQSMFDFVPHRTWDMVVIKGVLIHINPDMLDYVYKLLYDSSGKYVCIAEYYNPTPVEVVYRGHTGVLFKRDFAGDMLNKFPDLKLVDYGFSYHRDNNFPQDDITWFLMEKNHQPTVHMNIEN